MTYRRLRILAAVAAIMLALPAFAADNGAAVTPTQTTNTTTLTSAPVVIPANPAAGTPATVAPPATVTTTTVTVPVGNIANDILNILDGVLKVAITVFIGFVLRYLPAGAQTLINSLLTQQVEQLLAKAIDSGTNYVKGLTAGQTLDVNTGSQVLARALQYVVDNGWGWLINWAGGISGITAKILARLPLDAQTTTPEVVTAAKALPLAQAILSSSPAK